jgi:hypothetical protein
MKIFLLLLILMIPNSVFGLEIMWVKNVQLKGIFFYNGSTQTVHPEDGVVISVKGKASKQVELEIKTRGDVYLTPGARIANLKPKNRIITLNKYGEGDFYVGFLLLGETDVSGQHKKSIKYNVNYVD